MKKNKDERIIIRFDADKRAGMGHFNRCYALGKSLIRQGFDVLYCCRSFDKKIIDILKRNRNKYFLIPERFSWGDEAGYIFNELALNISGIVLDISTVYAFDNIRGIATYIKNLRKRCLVVLIDGMRGNALLSKADLRVDIAVMPYFGAEDIKWKSSPSLTYLTGPKYFIFSSEYARFKKGKRRVRRVADRVLVTLGGSDPCSATIKVLKAVAQIIDRKIYARVIMGPCFNQVLKDKIKLIAGRSRHKLEVVDSPVSLLRHMFWCDLAVTSSGLTKYEMAITGTPSLQVSFNKDYAAVNESFLKNGTAKHLGVYDAVSCQSISKAITGLLDNVRQRRFMSEAGKNLLDGLGTERIIEAIRRKL